MIGKCKLCNEENELAVSHFIPKFIGKWLKKTSITGFLRESNEVQKRAQDLAKEHWLCINCEGLFSAWETKFSNEIFHPFVNQKKSEANYLEWMSKFCASLSWRTLTYIRSKNTWEDKPEDYLHSLDCAESHLAKFLLGQTDNLNQYEQHFFPLEKIESTTENNLPVNINRYFLRTPAMDIIDNSKDIFTFTKLPSFIILGFIRVEKPQKMRSSRIALKSGKISPRKYWWPDGFISYIIKKANQVEEIYSQIPKNQREKFEEYIRQNPDKAIESKLFEAFLHDYSQFGGNVFR